MAGVLLVSRMLPPRETAGLIWKSGLASNMLHPNPVPERCRLMMFVSLGQLQARIQAHAQWIQRFLDAGWDGYFFTVMFNNLPGKRDTKIIQMHQEVTTLYGCLAKTMVRKRRSPKWAGYFPIAIFSPDLPVPKSRNGQKSTVADVSINEGLHSQGIVLANR
jgi:hypothetical protein